jgi:deoxyribodipyrimidine photo-lyase
VKANFHPGEAAARAALAGFLAPSRLKMYNDKRNDPNIPQAQSGLSPYFHFGQLSAQRAALEAVKCKKVAPSSVDAFLEEMVVRRELSDNFCFYEQKYDSLECAAGWARDSLELHAADKREHVYSRWAANPLGCIRMTIASTSQPCASSSHAAACG